MFKLYDGRTELFQWDVDIRVIVSDPTIDEVHFSNKTDDRALVVKVYELDGLRVANIPNILLQESWPIRAYAHCDGYTKDETIFNVVARNRPSDYVYTETEVITFNQLLQTVEEALQESGYYYPTMNEEGYLVFTPSREGMPTAEPVFVKGEKGDAGPIGPTGARGPEGPRGPQGERGEAFRYEDFTPEQLAALRGPEGARGPKGDKGDRGDAFTYDMFTPDQLNALVGPQGPKGEKGDKGDAFVYAMFTPEQLEALRGPEGP